MQCPLLTQTSTVTSSNEQINGNKINALVTYYTIYYHLLFIEPEYHALPNKMQPNQDVVCLILLLLCIVILLYVIICLSCSKPSKKKRKAADLHCLL